MISRCIEYTAGIALAALLVSKSNIAIADTGHIVFDGGYTCSYFVVESNFGYTVFEFFSGLEPEVGDRVFGEFDSFGMRPFYNITKDLEFDVWIEDFYLTEWSVKQKLQDKC